MNADRDRPRILTPREAWQRYLNQRRTESTAASMKTYRYRLKLFVEWCEGVGIETVDQLDGWDLDTYEGYRAGEGLAPSTLKGEMGTLKNFIEYLERIEAVDEDLGEKVHVPKVSHEDQSSDKKLGTPEGMALLRHHRNNPGSYARREHLLLEIAWFTGAREGGIRALDVMDVHVDERYLEFVHRPETGTPLKNKRDGERPVTVPRATMDVIERYLDHHREDRHDEHGRQPLLVSRGGRPATGTIRSWTYVATQPCVHGPCPHGKDPETCEYRQYAHASKCPSSRAPHHIRTGSITWQRDLGIPPEVVAERVNASIRTINTYYDKPVAHDRMQHRRPFVDRMDVDQENSEQ